ncbi:solute carrier family 25 member 38 [Cryomyces antarcticus]
MSNGGQSRKSSSSFHFIAGLGSGVVSAALLQPADLLKTRVQQSGSTTLIQTIREISNGPHPVRQFWRGTAPSVIRTGIGSALYFSGLNALRQSVARSNLLLAGSGGSTDGSYGSSSLPKLSNLANLTTGAIARASAGFIMTPITVIKVRYESSFYAYRTVLGAGRDILAKQGLRGFFAGFGATAVRDAPYAGLYVLFYEQSKRRLSSASPGTQQPARSMSISASAGINFMSGVVAAGLATAITNPFDAIKTRLQLMPARYENMVQAATIMLREDGVRSLFDGLALRIGRKALSSALAWTVYEELIRRAEESWSDSAETVL